MLGLTADNHLLCALILVGGGALACTAITYAMRYVSVYLGVVAKRDARRRHESTTPLLGGTGFYLTLMGLTAFTLIEPQFFSNTFGILPPSPRFGFSFALAITLIFGIGAFDDWRELKALPKFIVQACAAVLVIYSEPFLPKLLQGHSIPQWLIELILIFWMVGITNAVNMIDGLDGLCAGVAGLSAITLAMIMLGTDSPASFPLAIALVLAGSSVGFLVHNFNPAKIFLGDSGSTLLGFVLAVISVKMEEKRSLFISLSIPVGVLGLPLLDIILSMVRRGTQRRSLFRGDRSHLHHRLQQVGLGHRSAVALLWFASAYLNLMAYFLTRIPVKDSIFIYASAISTVGFWVLSLYFFEKRLSYQSARYSHFLMNEEPAATDIHDNRARVIEYMSVETKKSREANGQFVMVIIDSMEVLKQLAREKPSHVIDYYSKLYSILKARLRGSDLVARISERRIIAVLPGVDGEKTSPSYAVIDDLRMKVKALQESFQIFQTQDHSGMPEGFKILIYPRDHAKIQKALGFNPDQPDQKLAA